MKDAVAGRQVRYPWPSPVDHETALSFPVAWMPLETVGTPHLERHDAAHRAAGTWRALGPIGASGCGGRDRAHAHAPAWRAWRCSPSVSPTKLRVDNHAGSNPSIWLQSEEPMTGWIIVIVGTRDWCNLAYQFGHELGHVFGNSWELDAQPRSPCQWIEEALVEAFSLRGLGLLADDWAHAPPFPNDAAYAGAIRSYRETILASYRDSAQNEGAAAGFGAWFRTTGGVPQRAWRCRRRPRCRLDHARPIGGRSGLGRGYRGAESLAGAEWCASA